jgi:hypothetical protein
MICPYCKKGGIKFVDEDVTIESFCAFVDLIFKCENCDRTFGLTNRDRFLSEREVEREPI